METNWQAGLSLEECANYTGRSLSTFNRDFRKIFGQTPQRWMKQKKLENARMMLREEGSSVHEAMLDSGFGNLSYFSREYGRALGCPPSGDRRQPGRKIVIASDSFKGCLSSLEVASALKEGLLEADPSLDVVAVGMADGGEGTAQAVCDALGAKMTSCSVGGPLGDTVEAGYCLSGELAVIEMASAAGLTLIPEGSRNPLYTSTFGVGQMVLDALKHGARKFVIGLGGSATNDAATGMMSALGVRFLDADGKALEPVGANLEKICSMDLSTLDRRVRESSFTLACDVDTPFCGPRGAAAVFAPQKGADEAAVELLERGMKNFAGVILRQFGTDISDLLGAGAAGGLGGALKVLLQADMRRGAELILDTIGFDAMLDGASMVITGEGRLDDQTPLGKTACSVLRRARRRGIPVTAVCGCVEPCAELDALEFSRIVPVSPSWMSLSEAMDPDTAYQNVRRSAGLLI